VAAKILFHLGGTWAAGGAPHHDHFVNLRRRELCRGEHVLAGLMVRLTSPRMAVSKTLRAIWKRSARGSPLDPTASFSGRRGLQGI